MPNAPVIANKCFQMPEVLLQEAKSHVINTFYLDIQ